MAHAAKTYLVLLRRTRTLHEYCCVKVEGSTVDEAERMAKSIGFHASWLPSADPEVCDKSATATPVDRG